MSEFLLAAFGGVLIGLAAVLLLFSHGRIMGISGIVSGGLFADKGDKTWRLLIVAGILTPPAILALFADAAPRVTISDNGGLLLIAGFLVGLGTQIGGGCTSGHGVCGISRFSYRSIFATVTFITVGVITVFLMRQFGLIV